MAGYFVLSKEGKFQKSTKDGKNLLKDIYLKCTLGVRWWQLWPPDGLLCLTTELHSPLQVDVDMKQKCCCKCCYRAAVVWWPQYTAQYETRGGLSSVSAQRHSGSVLGILIRQLKRRVWCVQFEWRASDPPSFSVFSAACISIIALHDPIIIDKLASCPATLYSEGSRIDVWSSSYRNIIQTILHDYNCRSRTWEYFFFWRSWIGI